MQKNTLKLGILEYIVWFIIPLLLFPTIWTASGENPTIGSTTGVLAILIWLVIGPIFAYMGVLTRPILKYKQHKKNLLRLNRLNEKIQRWKEEGYKVDELEEKIESTELHEKIKISGEREILGKIEPKITAPKSNTVKVGIIITVIAIMVATGVFFLYYGQFSTVENAYTAPFVYTTPSINFQQDNQNNTLILTEIHGGGSPSDIQWDDIDITGTCSTDGLGIYVIPGDVITDCVGQISFKYIPSDTLLGFWEFTKENRIAIINLSSGFSPLIMKFELYEDKMPLTTENFIKLANDGFYDGLVIHRIVYDFAMQGGAYCPNGTLVESPYGPIDLEIHPDISHLNGVISMARTADPNSATSQFFICFGNQSHLDGDYAAFGKLIGEDEALQILGYYSIYRTTEKYGMKDWPEEDIIINSITIENQ